MPANTDHRQIPQFSLYGESAQRSLIDFVHIEEIKVRSSRHNWHISPHRHNTLFQILFIDQGDTTIQLDDSTRQVKGSCLITIPIGVVHSFHFKPQTVGHVLSLSVNHQGLDADKQLGPFFNEDLSQSHIFPLEDSNEQLFFHNFLKEIEKELAQQQRDHDLALFSLVKMILINIRRRTLNEGTQPTSVKQDLQLNERFRQLAEKKFNKHWSIIQYAEALHVSTSTLNRSCIKYLGESAKTYLRQRLHTEAKRLLIYTNESLDIIADQLGFNDAAYFSRVFKKGESCSPRDFRKKMNERIALINDQIV